ncbi:LutC/YkgG family protein [Corynebacterium lactis]|uniref:L-lactate utilization lutc protein n=1 Tax=Corynebacterium lactis RW2-5 TaxID=1408189 RepID=A0A0K2H020_9CORY|nr:LUD domain-containing protein [Corynebacterium lactis]ALA67081.1 l-lactate utilization lutc protein [Corynebacterium lactis RW2-5]
MTNSTAKEEILGRIRNAQKIAFSGKDLASSAGVVTGTPGEHFAVPRDYERTSDMPREEVISLADERIADYKADVRRCSAEPAEINEAVKKAVADAGAKIVGIPSGLDKAWVSGLDEGKGEIRVDEGLGVRDLDALDAIVTSSAVTCAETGTIFLDGSPACGRRALTLVPDVHICVVPADSVVYGIPESISRLRDADPTVPITMISGPSATSDIELNRVEGVHGPRTLMVIIAG